MSNVKAVFWDFGGVVTSSPFEAFARLEAESGLPAGFIASVNRINPDANAWAQFERSEIDRATFSRLFEAESKALGHSVPGDRVLACLAGEPRPVMVAALKAVRRRFTIACLTNNVAKLPRPPDQAAALQEVMALFHHVIESSKIGVRKPERAFYEHALAAVGCRADEAVFLDDLGVNLKTARAMGMTTIKVDAPELALEALSAILDLPLLAPGA